MNKGIVMEKKEKTLIVMTGDGQFREIARRKRACRVGEEVAFAPSEAVGRDRLTPFSVLSSLAAAILICVILFGGFSHVGDPASWFAGRSVVAYVSLDINPSVEIGVDKMEKVRALSSLNDDGAALIKGVEYKNNTLDDVMLELLAKAEGDYLSTGAGDIMITATAVKDSRLVDTRLTEELASTVKSYLEKNHSNEVENYEVAAVPTSPDLREEARKVDLSTGKYAAYLSAKNNGYAVTVDQFKTKSIRKLAAAAGDMESFIKAKELTKESLESLLQEEKSGELDRRLKNKPESVAPAETTNTPDPQAVRTTPSPSADTVQPVVNPASGNESEPAKKNGNGQHSPKSPNGKGNAGGKGNANGKGDQPSPSATASAKQTPAKGDTGKDAGSNQGSDKGSGKNDDSKQGDDGNKDNGGPKNGEDQKNNDSAQKENDGKQDQKDGDQKDHGKQDGNNDKGKGQDQKGKDGDNDGDGSWLGFP